MKDKIAFLMEETGCERGEAELALELCGYDLENAVQAIPRLFQNIAVIKGRMRARSESLYGLWLAILNIKERALLRARSVVSYNPAIYASEIDGHWFDFECRLYACRLWAGTLQGLSQEVEGLLASYFGSPQAAGLYNERARMGERELAPLQALLAGRLGELELQVHQDVLDMGQFQEVHPRSEAEAPRARRPSGASPGGVSPISAPLVLRVQLEPDSAGIPAAELKVGDLVYASIADSRDIAQYLARLFGSRAKDPHALLVPVEAIEGKVSIRTRLAAGLCGEVSVPPGTRLKVVRRRFGHTPWWRKIF